MIVLETLQGKGCNLFIANISLYFFRREIAVYTNAVYLKPNKRVQNIIINK